eukprot:TRINITY_DN11844_c0_g1_i1.p1 TRINITY_DN11844_c0_g1~~TRINITY_DN11844_c0_g1_i1.p1  ORF type:complete len:467 (+),score=140.35 TRINITY_DN11844_c0_g1_i1:81-1403(+)
MTPARARVAVTATLAAAFAAAATASLAAAEANAGGDVWEALLQEAEARGVPGLQRSWQGVGFDALQHALPSSSSQGRRHAVVLAGGGGTALLAAEVAGAGWSVTAFDRSAAATKACEASAAATAAAARNASGAAGGSLRCFQADVVAAPLSLDAGSADVFLEVGFVDDLLAGLGGADDGSGASDAVPGAASGAAASAVLREAYRVLQGKGVLISVSAEPAAFRRPLFAADAWGDVSASTLPRPRQLDERVLALDPDLDVGALALLVARKSAGASAAALPTEVAADAPEPAAEPMAEEGAAVVGDVEATAAAAEPSATAAAASADVAPAAAGEDAAAAAATATADATAATAAAHADAAAEMSDSALADKQVPQPPAHVDTAATAGGIEDASHGDSSTAAAEGVVAEEGALPPAPPLPAGGDLPPAPPVPVKPAASPDSASS